MKNRTCLLSWSMIVLALTATPSLAQSVYEPYAFTTFVGTTYGNADGTGSAAQFYQPQAVAVDSAGNVYVADTGNHTIRKLTPAGVVTTLAGLAGSFGSADGTGVTARFNQPSGVAVDSAGTVYVGDSGNNTIRKVTPMGVVTTLAGVAGIFGSADGTGDVARFNQASGVTVDTAGNVYVTDKSNNTIRKVTPAGLVTTLAGLAGTPGSMDGPGSAARFYGPSGLAVDSAGNIYVADTGNNTIRMVTPRAAVVTTLAGLAGGRGSADGTGSAAQFGGNAFYGGTTGVAVDSAGIVYVADTGNNTIRKITPVGVVTTVAGLVQCCYEFGYSLGGSADGTGDAARFNQPSGVAVDSTGIVYVADKSNNTIRKMTSTGVVTTLAGLAVNPGTADGTGSAARFNQPSGIVADSAAIVYVADQANSTIRKVTPAGAVTTLAGLAGYSGSVDGTGSSALFTYPTGLALDKEGNLYVADAGNNTIRKVTPAGVVTTLAGLTVCCDIFFGGPANGSADGTGSDARFFRPTGVAVDSAGNVYVADRGNDTIRKVTQAGVVTTLAGLASWNGSGDGTGSDARFFLPSGVAVDSTGIVYVADQGNYTIRKVTPAGVVTTLAGLAGHNGSADGIGSAAQFWEPSGLALDSAGNLYVAELYNWTIRKITPAGAVTTLAGLAGNLGNADGIGRAARFNHPSGIAVDSAGNIYVTDQFNNTVRKGYPEAVPAVIVKSRLGFGFNPGQFGFNLTGPAGQLVVVEASTTLASWLPLWTNTFTSSAALNFNDPQSSLSSNRFYRAHLP